MGLKQRVCCLVVRNDMALCLVTAFEDYLNRQ